MKKLLLSAAAFAVVAVSAVTVAPTTSEAIPAFARQTGAACLQCHHLSFPTLAAFGRSFKQGAYTDVGELALIEDDNLSITSVLNFSIVLRQKFISTNNPAPTADTKTVALPADTVLLFGGRVSSNSGAFIEYEAGFANYQLINSWDVGGGKAGVSFFNSGFGDTFGIEVGSTYGQHGGLFGAKELTANKQMYDSVGGIGGVALFYANDIVTASLSGITASLALDGATDNNWKLAPSLRVFAVQEFGGAEFGLGVVWTGGNTGNLNTVTALNTALVAAGGAPLAATVTQLEMKKWAIDFQVQGEMNDVGFDFYADYASSDSNTTGGTKFNLFNNDGVLGQAGKLDGWSVRGDIKPLHNVIFGAAYGKLSNDLNDRKQWQIAAEYELFQNMTVSLIYRSVDETIGGVSSKTSTTTLDIEALM